MRRFKITKSLILLFILFYNINILANNNNYDKLFLSAGITYKVPWKLLKAICLTESNLNPNALNFNDNGKGSPAIGMCQVLYLTAIRDLGYIQLDNNKCQVNLPINKRNKANCYLYDAETNIKYASLYLKYQLIRYNNNWSDAIAAYNSGSVRFDKYGKYRNQKYIDKVLQNLSDI